MAGSAIKKAFSLLAQNESRGAGFFCSSFNNDFVKNSTVVLCYDMKYLCATLRNRGGSLRNNSFWVGCYAKLRGE